MRRGCSSTRSASPGGRAAAAMAERRWIAWARTGTTVALRTLGYAFPMPALGAVASLLFLFNEGNSMWGGNIPSTLAGEFAHSAGFAFAVLFLGLVYRGIEENRHWRSRSVVLAIAGLCHPVAFLNAAAPGVFFLFDRED